MHDEETVYIRWLDKRAVMHPATDSVPMRYGQEGEARSTIISHKVTLGPASLQSSNCFIGGVDVFDHLVTAYKILHKSGKS